MNFELIKSNMSRFEGRSNLTSAKNEIDLVGFEIGRPEFSVTNVS